MVFATGDTHGNFLRFRPENFPEQENMTKNDYVIICGDFGGVWDGSKKSVKHWTGWRVCRLRYCSYLATTRTLTC